MDIDGDMGTDLIDIGDIIRHIDGQDVDMGYIDHIDTRHITQRIAPITGITK